MPWYNSLGIINAGQAKQNELDMLNQAKMQEIERQKQAISGGLQALFPDQQVPFIDESKTMGTMDDPLYAMTQYDPMMFVKNLKGIMPEQADAVAGAYVADQTGSNEFGKALLSQFFPKATGEDPAVIKISDQIAAGMGFKRGTPEYAALVATVAKNPTTLNLGNQQFVSNPILDQAVRSLQEKAKKDSKGNPIYTDADKQAIERINSIAAMTGSQRYDINLSPENQPNVRAQQARAVDEQKNVAALNNSMFTITNTLPDINRQLDDAITLLARNDTDTGPIYDRLPTIQAGSYELDNIRKNLGLSVVALGKFGQLSASEGEWAKTIDIPSGLPKPELKALLEKKKKYNQEMHAALLNAMQYLNTPNKDGTLRTLADLQTAKSVGAVKSAYDINKPQSQPQQDSWKDNQYEYRRLPDGRVQRRKL